MDSFQITGEDAASIALALIADNFQGQKIIQVETLQSHWAGLGLRLDDLVQGLTLLAREQQLSIDGNIEGAELTLSDAIIEAQSEESQGLAHLAPALQNILKIAAERSKDSGTTDSERRGGFS